MVKGRVAPPKCLFRVATETGQDQCTLIEQSAHLVLVFANTTQLYNLLIINLAIALHDVYMQLRYTMCMISLLSSSASVASYIA